MTDSGCQLAKFEINRSGAGLFVKNGLAQPTINHKMWF